MVTPPDDTTADLHAVIASLRQQLAERWAERDAALRTLAERTTELAHRNSEYGERIEHQAATIDVLKAMSASPGDPQPVFDLIVDRARDLCDAYGATVYEFDGTEIHWRAATGVSDDPAVRAAYEAQFPMVPTRDWHFGRAILDRRIIRIDDQELEPGLDPTLRGITAKSNVTIPIMRGDAVIGAIGLGSREKGGFSDSQVELLKTFAEQAAIAITSAETYRALQERTAALAQRNSEFGERIKQQAATIDVLKLMSASPGNAQPVFDLIVERARDLCEGYGATVLEFDGRLLLHRASTGIDDDAVIRDAIIAAYPKAPDRSWPIDLAVLERRLIIVDDLETEPNLGPTLRNLTHKSVVAMPLMRGEVAIGALTLGGRERGGFSDSQIELLKTFAEQAVIAITSAETYRALQTRTTDLQQSLEYQTATSEVLNVISRSTFDLQPVLDTLVEAAARLCNADQAIINRREGVGLRLAANFGFPPEYEAHFRSHGLVSIDAHTASARAATERRPVHTHDVRTVPGYPEAPILLGKQRTSFGVPMLREGEVIGTIVLARQRVEPFTDLQIELVRTFADQAVIAIENTRLMTEQREALEQQTATAEVLGVINSSPGNLVPVFDAMLEKAIRLCDAAFGNLATFDGRHFNLVATHYVGSEYSPPHTAILPDPGSALERIVKGDRVVQIANLVDTDAYRQRVPSRVELVERLKARSALWVALRKDDAVVGVFVIFRREGQPFSDKQVALLENFAAQAVIAMENARLINETREALEQQTATAEVLQVINSSPGDLAPVFDAMVEKAMRLCEAPFGILQTYDGEEFHIVSRRGVTPELAEYLRQPVRVAHGQALYRIVRGSEDVVHEADITEEEGYRVGNAARRAMADLGGARTQLAVALRKDNALLGAFTIYRREVRPFTDRQIALVQNFAAQAVIATENARLITEQREALEQQTATAEVLRVINSSPGDLTPVFETMLDKATQLCNAGFGIMQTYDGDHLHAVALHNVPAAFAEFAREPWRLPSGGNWARLLAGEAVIHEADIAASDPSPVRRAFVDLGGARTSVRVALRAENRFLGLFNLYRQEVKPFSDKEIALLQNFAAQAVIAMENARLINETREALERQTATSEVLQVINSSPGNLAPVFDAMLEKAMGLCGAAKGGIYSFDGQWFKPVALRGVSSAFIDFSAEHPVPSGPRDAPTRILETRRPVQIPDLADLSDYSRGMVELGGIRALLDVPLLKEGIVVGFIAIYREEAGPFSDKEIALLENFASQAVIAMENARLLDEIRQRQAELRITFDNMGDGVAMFDAEHRLAAWNLNFQELLDIPDAMLAERPSYGDYLRLLAERGEFGAEDVEAELARRLWDIDQELRLERTRPDGRVIEVRHNVVPDGGFVLIYSDITERKRSEEEVRAARDAAEAAYRDLKAAQASLIQAEKMASLGQLTAGIAHEIKNPLNFVNNFAELSGDLLDELHDAVATNQQAEIDELTATLKGNLAKIAEHGKRADGIVRSMLEHSRGSSGERRSVDLNALVEEALNLAYHGARARDQSFNITLERDFDEGIAPITLVPQDATRVLLNLFSNGFYAARRRQSMEGVTGFEPTLSIATRELGDAVEIRVRDNGTGIPEEVKDKLFQPFFTTKPTGEGTGLGLSISYDIVTQQHGGSITVDSKVGEFTEFVVTLPRK
jgi:GAF domain-containing protein